MQQRHLLKSEGMTRECCVCMWIMLVLYLGMTEKVEINGFSYEYDQVSAV